MYPTIPVPAILAHFSPSLSLSLPRGHSGPISVQSNPRWYGRHQEDDEEERRKDERDRLKEASSGFSIQYVHNDFH